MAQSTNEAEGQAKALMFSKPTEAKVKHEFLLSAEELTKFAQSGDPRGQYMLGVSLRGGLAGFVINKEEGNKWITLAKASDSPAGYAAQGLCLEEAICGVIVKNLEAAKAKFARAAQENYIPAIYKWAYLLADEEDKADQSIREGHSGHTVQAALANLAVSHQEIRQQIVSMMAICAEAGYAPAQCYLGWCYDIGWGGCKQDPAEAVKLYALAAAQGYAHSKKSLGLCFKKGYGVAFNASKAIELLTSAAQQKNAMAECELGLCYRDGIAGQFKDRKEAIYWLSLASQHGNKCAQDALVKLQNESSCTII